MVAQAEDRQERQELLHRQAAGDEAVWVPWWFRIDIPCIYSECLAEVSYPRIYTTQFASALLGAYREWCQLPADQRGDIRARRSVDTKKTDRELFMGMEMGDLWLDSDIHKVFMYLYGCKYCKTSTASVYVMSVDLRLPLPSPALSKDPGVVAQCAQQFPRGGQR